MHLCGIQGVIHMNEHATIRVTKQFRFEMAHALDEHAGACSNIHGHSYELSVTVKGRICTATGSKNGMVIDFSELKDLVEKHIVHRFDHVLILNDRSPYRKLAGKENGPENIVLSPFQPTCENLLSYFADIIAEKLPMEATLHHLKLRETPSSYCEWFAEDQHEQ
ncbi:MAG: 6-carboxytetrahydropterin synthase [Bacteroidota bacterium]